MTDDNLPPSSPPEPTAPSAPAHLAAPAPPAQPADDSDRKDRLVQTRVPRELERRVKGEARRRRLSVSQFVRTLLEDALILVDDVLENVDDIVADSVDFADQVRRDAQSLARTASREGRRVADAVRSRRDEVDERDEPDEGRERHVRRESDADDPGPQAPGDRLAHVVAWNAVILNRNERCVQCDIELARGEHAHLGVDERAGHRPSLLCGRCIADVQQERS